MIDENMTYSSKTVFRQSSLPEAIFYVLFSVFMKPDEQTNSVLYCFTLVFSQIEFQLSQAKGRQSN